MKKGCYISIYSDYGFLDLVLNLLNQTMDEIVIVDGPFEYCISTLKKLNLYYDENNSPIKSIISKYGNKIKYFYKHFKDEKEKRIFGYEQCSTDIVMLADSDEIYLLNEVFINNFYNSKKSVISLDIYNMCRTNIGFDKKSRKYILFKKKNISALEHLSYTWLVGVDGLPNKNTNLMELNNIAGVILHQTLNRTKEFSLTKFIFYTRLWYHNNNKEKIDYLWDVYKLDDLLEKYSVEEVKNIFYHSYFPSINLCEPKDNKILYKTPICSLNLEKYEKNHSEAYFKPNSLVLKDLKYIFYLPKLFYKDNKINIRFDTENISECTINIYDICIGKSWNKYTYNQTVENDSFIIKDNLNNNERIDMVVEFICKTKTDIGGRIKNILDNDIKYKLVSDKNWIDGEGKIDRNRIVTSENIENGDYWPQKAFSRIGIKRINNIKFCIEEIKKNNIKGDFLEAGVWRGGATIFMAHLNKLFNMNRKIYVADSFEGLPSPEDKFPDDEGDIHHTIKILSVSMEEVKNNFNEFSLLDDNIKFIKGYFQNSLKNTSVESLSLLRVDADMYSGTYSVLENLYDKVNKGGFIIIDDYGYGPCRNAVTNFRNENNITSEIKSIDHTGVYWIKQ